MSLQAGSSLAASRMRARIRSHGAFDQQAFFAVEAAQGLLGGHAASLSPL